MFEKRRISEIAKRVTEIDMLAAEQARTSQTYDDETGEPLWNPDGTPKRPDRSYTTEQYMEYQRLIAEAKRLVDGATT